MRQTGLRGISRAKGPRTTVPGSGPDTRLDLVDRGFRAEARPPLVADITYCRTFAGWAYAAFVLAVFSRRASWAGSCQPACGQTSALDALEMGLWTRQCEDLDPHGLIHHSDRASKGDGAGRRGARDCRQLHRAP
jgi:putative transposase